MSTYDRSSQDVGNILPLEHISLTVPDQRLAALFYVSGLGFTRDACIDPGLRDRWINVSQLQIHLRALINRNAALDFLNHRKGHEQYYPQ